MQMNIRWVKKRLYVAVCPYDKKEDNNKKNTKSLPGCILKYAKAHLISLLYVCKDCVKKKDEAGGSMPQSTFSIGTWFLGLSGT